MLELTDNSYQQEIASALRHNDINRIEDFFKSPLYRECINGKYCDIMGMQLLSLLYNYLEDIHFTPNALNTSRAHTMKLFSELPNCALKANYVESTYFDVLNVIHQQKGNNTEALYRYAIQFIDQHYTDPDFTISFLASEYFPFLPEYLVQTVFREKPEQLYHGKAVGICENAPALSSVFHQRDRTPVRL